MPVASPTTPNPAITREQQEQQLLHDQQQQQLRLQQQQEAEKMSWDEGVFEIKKIYFIANDTNNADVINMTDINFTTNENIYLVGLLQLVQQ